MTDSREIGIIDDDSSLHEVLKDSATFQSYDSLPVVDFNDEYFCADYNTSGSIYLGNFARMISTNLYSVSGNILNCSYGSVDSLGDNVLEEDGRISLAYENLKSIPKRIAEKFGMKIRFLDLSHNNFQNLSFLSFFEDLHTLILDRNTNLDVQTLPCLPNLKILWINNCDIKNVVDWIQRIQVQCPTLEYLSIMGNPGIKEPFSNCILNILGNRPLNGESPSTPTNSQAEYKAFILQMLPNLQYLDDVPRKTISKLYRCPANGFKPLTNSTSMTSSANGSATSQGQQCKNNSKSERKTSTTVSFKNLFLLKRRKTSYPSSSTN